MLLFQEELPFPFKIRIFHFHFHQKSDNFYGNNNNHITKVGTNDHFYEK